MEGNFQLEQRKVMEMHDNVQVVILFQNPRQWALEVVNERYELPSSNEYLKVLSEWVIVSTGPSLYKDKFLGTFGRVRKNEFGKWNVFTIKNCVI